MTKRAPFKYGRGRCIFCEKQPPKVKISKEHIFAEWLRVLFPRSPNATHTVGIMSWAGTPGRSARTINSKVGQGHSGSKKVRAVCRECNGTWLSNLVEEPAKPLLLQMIKGERLDINSDMQQLLATWAAKTAITYDQIDPSRAVVLQSERTWLKDRLIPPGGWNIWAGSYSGVTWAELGIYQRSATLTVPGTDNNDLIVHNLQLTTIGMGHLFFLLINSSWPKIWEMLDELGNPQEMLLDRIWPPQHSVIRWPRLFAVRDAHIDELHRIYGRIVEQPK